MAITRRRLGAIMALFSLNLLVFLLQPGISVAADFVEIVRAVKPSVVAVGTFQKNRSPSVIFVATGFAVADGLTIVTNAHTIRPVLDTANNEILIVLTGQGSEYQPREARVLVTDKTHDLTLLRIKGAPLPALKLGDSTQISDGQPLAFTGYPLAMGLGLYAATHRATLSAIVPIAQPTPTARQLSPTTINRVREGSFAVFQLDGTAYPGNSGSPLYDPTTGEVLGVISATAVKGAKENALTKPSGISYAIPSQHIKSLLENGAKD